jgi:hypothetical protein
MQFVVTADCNPSAGDMTITFEPEIVTAGAYQNVSNAAANNKAITVFGAASTSTAQGLAFHKDFMTLAMVDLYVPKGVDLAGRRPRRSGTSRSGSSGSTTASPTS